jgi:hypothetical protein
VRTFRWLAQFNDVIARAQATAATEVGLASPRAVLLEHAIDAASLELSEEKVRRKQRIAYENGVRLT